MVTSKSPVTLTSRSRSFIFTEIIENPKGDLYLKFGQDWSAQSKVIKYNMFWGKILIFEHPSISPFLNGTSPSLVPALHTKSENIMALRF